MFDTKWGSQGAGDGQFMYPAGIAVDGSGYVYVTDHGNNRIQKFTSDGQFVTKWGSLGTGDGQFNFGHPYNQVSGIAVDGSGYVYVVDTFNFRIQKFKPVSDDSGGLNYIFDTKWGIKGSNPGQFNNPRGIGISPTGLFYVVDGGNNRIQVFRKVETSSKNKAIIVAGGGPFPGNDLWDATQMSANFAYRTLTYQGFTKENIHYLTWANIDLDNNGVLDDIAGDATNANLQNAIINWASGAEDVIVYLVDHGGVDSFRMSGNETLSSAQLALWLNTLQNNITGKAIVIYDACESGSFVGDLTPPPGKSRIVIASASPGESAYFVTQGSVSFSNYFWTHIFNGVNIKDAFALTREAIKYTTTYQNPLIDANGNGTANEAQDLTLVQNTYIGSGTVIFGSAPVICSVSPEQTIDGSSSALLVADGVTDADWVKFYAIKNQVYEMKAGNLGPNADVVLELYRAGNMTSNLIAGLGDRGGYGEDELVSWTAPDSGIYYLKVRQDDPSGFGEGTHYDLKVYRPAAPDIGTITGIIISDTDLARIASATIQAGLGSAFSDDGSFILKVEAGTVSLAVNAEGYSSTTVQDVVVQAGQETSLTVMMASVSYFTITTTAGQNGTISCTPNPVNYGSGSTCTISFTAGYTVDAFTVDGNSATLTNNQYVFSNVTANHVVNVTFRIIQFAITATAGQNGTISCTPNPVNYGSVSTCTISPTAGYTVDAFTVDGNSATLTNNQYVFSNVTANHVVNVSLKPVVMHGDVNNDRSVDLADAILALKAVSGIPAAIHKDADINGDGKIGLAEVIYILQKAAGLRAQ